MSWVGTCPVPEEPVTDTGFDVVGVIVAEVEAGIGLVAVVGRQLIH